MYIIEIFNQLQLMMFLWPTGMLQYTDSLQTSQTTQLRVSKYSTNTTSLSHTALATFQWNYSDDKATIHVISVTVCTTVFPLLLQTFKM
jgi:hypothetical protein